jgi:uncharacterized protein (TIGR01244 family)
MPIINRIVSAICLGAALALAGCAGLPEATQDAPASAPALTVTPSGVALAQPRPGLYVAGQPAADDWRALADAGVRTVINLRTAGELEGRDERAEVEAAGLRYVEIPVAGAGGITAENATALNAALAAGGADGQGVLLHCASGNRAGGLLAVALQQQGVPADQALQQGRVAGMRSTETRARAVMGLPACPAPDADADAAKVGGAGGNAAQCP